MDMRKYSGEHYVKVDDVKDGPFEGQIAAVKEGKFDKPNIVFESGDVLSLNATNNKILMRAYGTDSDRWIGKMIQMFLGEIEYQGAPREAVLIKPISPPLKKDKAEKAADEKKPSATPGLDDEIPL